MMLDCNSSTAESTQSVSFSKMRTISDRIDLPSIPPGSNRRKSVSFVDEIHAVVAMLVPYYEMKKEERRAIWWSKKDFKIFQQHAQMLASHERQLRCQFHDPCTPPPCEYLRMKRFVETNCTTEDVTEPIFVNFRIDMITQELRCSSVPELRGLEQWTSRSYSETKKALTEEHRKTVLKSNRNTVAEKSAEKSRVCRLLARFWGEVDSQMVREQSSSSADSDSGFGGSFQTRTKSPTSLLESRPIKLPIQHRGIA